MNFSSTYPGVTIRLPEWMAPSLPSEDMRFPTMEEKMRFVIELSRQNIRNETGGPFGAAIFDMATDRLFAPGVNLVLSTNCSMLHAEMVAMTIAQQRLGNFDLGCDANRRFELVSSTEPCAMCFGAVPWSGVRRLVCGARDEDARAVGFDEGPKLTDWISPLEKRNIRVVRDICREEAAQVLRDYEAMGGMIYNSRDGECVTN